MHERDSPNGAQSPMPIVLPAASGGWRQVFVFSAKWLARGGEAIDATLSSIGGMVGLVVRKEIDHAPTPSSESQTNPCTEG